MTMQSDTHKLTCERLSRKAIVYLRQSSERQVQHNVESQQLQYALVERARALGFSEIEVVDDDLGSSAAEGSSKRVGFEHVLSEIAVGRVGLLLSREVSRLLRTDKDWCQLVEVCRLFDTLIGDNDGLYDVGTTNDQLILGIKGTMSVAELRTLQLRCAEGIRAKAARGELYQGRLAAGYEFNAAGQLVKDPNVRTQEAIALIFKKFQETWTIRRTHQWFRDHSIEVPVRQRGNRLQWRVPYHEYIAGVLRHPIYAGAYVYGRVQSETVWQDGQLIKRRRTKSRDQWHVLLQEHHEGYISWEMFEENQKRMSKNIPRSRQSDSVLAIREGKALLAGILRCGKCGRRLGVRYTGKAQRTSPQYNCQGDYKAGGNTCQWIGGALVHRAFETQLLQALSSLGIEASLRAESLHENKGAEQCMALERQLEQVRYEVLRAQEQYDSVDPRNRLVASQLEERWNERLQQQHQLEHKLHQLKDRYKSLTEEERFQIRRLGTRFEEVWHSPDCTADLKKKIIRTAVEEIVVDKDDQASVVKMLIHWSGGTHTKIMIPHNVRSPNETDDGAIEIVKKMAVRFGDEDIARVLNQEGYRTGQGNEWNVRRVASLRWKHNVPGRRVTLPRPGFLSLSAAAAQTGASDTTLLKLIRRGIIYAEQIVPRAPWEIRQSDLDSNRVSQMLDHLRAHGRLPRSVGPAENQRELF